MTLPAGDDTRCILYVTHTSIISGAEHALLELLCGLPDTLALRVLCPPGELADWLRAEGFAGGEIPGTSASLRFSPLHTLRGAWRLLVSAIHVRKTASRSDACLVHANSIRAGLIAVVASFLGGPPVVVHVHDVMPESRVTRLIRQLLLRRANGLIAVSHYARRKFLAALPPSERPFPVLYNPIDVARFAGDGASREEARRRIGTAPDGPLLGIVAQITPWKGHDTAIAALAQLRRSHPTARLVCVGEAKFVGAGTRFNNVCFEERLRRLTADLGLDDAVEFWGQRDDVPAILAALDALLVPSWEEPLGRTMLEAMAAGTPVVATAVGGTTEVIEDGVAGFLVDPKDPSAWARTIDRLLDDQDMAYRIAASGRKRVAEAFSRDTYVRQVLDLYESIMDRD